MENQVKVGMPAPDFEGRDQNGRLVSLKSFRGKKLAVYFYPKDLTPTCTVQACNLRDNYGLLAQNSIAVLGISPDTEALHTKFIAKHNLPFSLLVDTDRKMAQDFGVWRLKKFMGREYVGIVRTTFLIDENGIIEKIIDKVVSKNHAAQLLAAD